MEMIKTMVLYTLSLMAARALRLMTPIEFEDNDCCSVYTTRVDKGDVTYIVTVHQWRMDSKTRLRLFDGSTRYYNSEVLVLYKDEVILNKQGFFPEPSLGFLGKTKLPHAIIALAALDKVQLEIEKSKLTA